MTCQNLAGFSWESVCHGCSLSLSICPDSPWFTLAPPLAACSPRGDLLDTRLLRATVLKGILEQVRERMPYLSSIFARLFRVICVF